MLAGHRVVDIDLTTDGVLLGLLGPTMSLAADAAVVAPGPWAAALLPELGVELQLQPVLEQVTYLDGKPGWEDLPCIYDGPNGDDVGLYAMPTGGLGYKIGLDLPLRAFMPADLDRVPARYRDELAASRVARDFEALEPRVLSSEVCTWTMSPDGRFVIDRLHDGRIVLACGDSGTGFKFSALMGQILADQVEGSPVDAYVASFGLARFVDGVSPAPEYHVFGQPPSVGLASPDD